MTWILASASPRRRELLLSLGLEFQIVPSSAEELHDERLRLEELCGVNASLKANEVARRNPDSIVIGADTLVALDGQLFGKPVDLADARSMLTRLSGCTHEVVTGVCLVHAASGRKETFFDKTRVTFKQFGPSVAADYIRAVDVLDKAGAYGIQERGEMIVERIEGSFSNVMGFPTEKFRERLPAWLAIR